MPRFILILAICGLSLFLASCTLSTKTPSETTPENGYNESGKAGDSRGGRGRSGTGGMRAGSGKNFIINQVAPADRVLFQQLMEAKKDNDTAKVKELEDQIKQKYPTMQFGTGAKRPSSGSGINHSGNIQR